MRQTLIALDQVINTLVWLRCDGWGMADETLSARAWRLRNVSRAFCIIDAILFFDRQGPKRHCQLSFESEILRSQLPAGYRAKGGL